MSSGRGDRLHYGWVVVGVTAAALLVSVGVRTAPGVLIAPLERDLGWSRAAIAGAVAIGLLLYGLTGPFAGGLMQYFGPRRLAMLGLLLMGSSTAASAAMTALWQLPLLWGVLSGLGTGLAAPVLGVTVATRWFVARRGLVLGLLGATSSAGQLLFVPLLMWVAVTVGWRGSMLVLAGLALLLVAPVAALLRDEPADLHLQPYGGAVPVEAATVSSTSGGSALRHAASTPAFWLLAGSFFICGATSNGLVTTHFIAHATDHGIGEVTAAGALTVMGSMNFIGTVASGWLTDRFDPRKLLACYYLCRGLSLFLLPFVTDFAGLAIFAVIFGLDYYATVPPTTALTADLFGRRHIGVVFGWIFVAHQSGAAVGAALGGVARVALGDYQLAFLAAGALVGVGALMTLYIQPVALLRLAATKS